MSEKRPKLRLHVEPGDDAIEVIGALMKVKPPIRNIEFVVPTQEEADQVREHLKEYPGRTITVTTAGT
jgi:hypothetical protein